MLHRCRIAEWVRGDAGACAARTRRLLLSTASKACGAGISSVAHPETPCYRTAAIQAPQALEQVCRALDHRSVGAVHSTFVRRSPEWPPGRESESVAEGGSQEQSPVSGVAERYATALFELASEAKTVDAVAKDLDGFAAMIAESDDLKRLVESPAFSAQDQVSAITALTAKAGISGLAANFIGFVASKRRLFALPGMIRAFRAKVAEAKGVVSAEVTLAEQPSAAQLKDITAALKEVAGKDVDVSLKVDPAIIGGLVVKMGSRMVDASLKTKLNSIRLAMKEVG